MIVKSIDRNFCDTDAVQQTCHYTYLHNSNHYNCVS